MLHTKPIIDYGVLLLFQKKNKKKNGTKPLNHREKPRWRQWAVWKKYLEVFLLISPAIMMT